ASVAMHVHSRKTTEEVRLTSPSGRRVDWIVGYYYTDENANTPQSIEQYNAQGSVDAPLLQDFSIGIASVLRENAGYGDLTYHFSRAFDLQGGVRYDSVTQEYSQPYFTFAGAASPPEIGAVTLSKVTYLG